MTDESFRRRSTGVRILDRVLDGGIPTGSLVALCAGADSQSHLLVSAAASAATTTYLSTYRPPAAVDADADVRELHAARLADDPERLAAAVPEDGYLVVDRLNDVESLGVETVRAALNALGSACRERNTVALLHCLGDEDTAARSLSLARSDLVFRLVRTVTSLTVDHRLVVTKYRRGRAPAEPIKLKLGDRVAIDTSRDIA